MSPSFLARAAASTALAATGLAALMALTAPPAHSQLTASPSYLPIGVSASGSTSTVWFHEPQSRQTIACQTVASGGAGGLASIHCVTARLP